MTDYIETILREQTRREERRVETDWRKAWEETALPLGEGQEEEGGGTLSHASAGDVTERDPGAGETAAEDVAAGRAFPWEPAVSPRPLTAGAEAGEAAPPAADWLEQAVGKSLTELPAPRRESRVVTLSRPGEAERRTAWDVETLDRLIRRDARRFDGGFQLL